MAQTNFAALLTEQKKVWSRDLWKIARNNSFIQQFAGNGHNAMVTRITELTRDERGDRAVLTLVPDLETDGVMGDSQLENNEEAIKAFDEVITIDQVRNANRTTGRMNDQKTIIRFRETSRDVLGYWLADRCDQLAFLSLSGISYTMKNNGVARAVLPAGQNFSELAYSADVSIPTAARRLRWDASTEALVSSEQTDLTFTAAQPQITAADKLSYKALVRLKAYAKDHYIRGIRSKGNEEFFHVFVNPQTMASLKLDPDYITNVRHAGVRGKGNELFAGTSSVMVDGLVVHEFRHVYNTGGAAAGAKWGAAQDVEGCRVLFCGAQALGMADLGLPYWDEDKFDYMNQSGISIGKIMGFLNPVWRSAITGVDENFATITLDVAQ